LIGHDKTTLKFGRFEENNAEICFLSFYAPLYIATIITMEMNACPY